MKAVRLDELKTLVESNEFLDFWAKLKQARQAFVGASEQYDELLTQVTLTDFRAELAQKNGIDTLYAADEAEDTAAKLHAESSGYENRGLDVVARFEDQRFVASDAWYKLSAAERALEDMKEQAVEARAKKASNASRLDADVKRSDREVAELREAYKREEKKKLALWEQVEGLWARSAELSLIVAEKKLESKKIKKQAEVLFRQAEERRVRGRKLREDAEAASRVRSEAQKSAEMLLKDVLARFGGVAVGDFLYFRNRDDLKSAFAVGLVTDSDCYNLEVQELHLYQVDRVRGVAFLEPAVEKSSSDDEGDRRFEEYFLHGRKGQVRNATYASAPAQAG